MSALLSGRATAGPGVQWLARAFAVLAVVALVVADLWVGTQWGWSMESLGHASGTTLVAWAVLYVVLLALPFVPGIEVGLAMMLLFGRDGVVLVYACTQIALMLGFAAGRVLPAWVLAERLRQFQRARTPLPRAWRQRAIEHRYLALAAALNLPGNAAVGGAGGIALLAGACGLYTLPRYVLAVAIGTMPIPAALLVSGLV